MSSEVLEKLVLVLAGLVTGMAGTLFVTARDNAYLKGQLDQVIRVVEAFKRVAEHVAVLDKAQLKNGIDIAHAHEKIRKLERTMANGEGHQS